LPESGIVQTRRNIALGDEPNNPGLQIPYLFVFFPEPSVFLFSLALSARVCEAAEVAGRKSKTKKKQRETPERQRHYPRWSCVAESQQQQKQVAAPAPAPAPKTGAASFIEIYFGVAIVVVVTHSCLRA
jgi:hypothetical protein